MIDGGLVAHLTMASQKESELAHCGIGSFLTRVFNGQQIKQRIKDGFLDGTAIAKSGDKRLHDYSRNKTSVKFVQLLHKKVCQKNHQVFALHVHI